MGFKEEFLKSLSFIKIAVFKSFKLLTDFSAIQVSNCFKISDSVILTFSHDFTQTKITLQPNIFLTFQIITQ
jgi:hypothetical protein